MAGTLIECCAGCRTCGPRRSLSLRAGSPGQMVGVDPRINQSHTVVVDAAGPTALRAWRPVYARLFPRRLSGPEYCRRSW